MLTTGRDNLIDYGNPFRPGDKVIDERDHGKALWRIISVLAEQDTERMTLRQCDDPSDERSVLARDVAPFLVLVAKAKPGGGDE